MSKRRNVNLYKCRLFGSTSSIVSGAHAVYRWGSRWKSRILQKVADNVQIEFTNVVIRYEDVISAPEHPFVMHVKFDELSVKSTDESWEALFVKDEIAPVGYTLAHLSGFQMTLGALKERFDTKSSSK